MTWYLWLNVLVCLSLLFLALSCFASNNSPSYVRVKLLIVGGALGCYATLVGVIIVIYWLFHSLLLFLNLWRVT